jgi:DNA-binding response OmpR family regulator
MNERAESPQRILVADDDRHIADLVRMYLAKAGYDVTLARDGNETQRLLREQPFDLAVLDIMMPGADGLQIIRNLRKRSDLPVIFLTARTSDVDKVAGLQFGADDYVTKPFNPTELVARVQSVLRRTRSSHPPNRPASASPSASCAWTSATAPPPSKASRLR